MIADSLGPQFDLRSRMSNKPNAQGSLFSASPSQRTPASRQPRGYSPQRMADVREKLPIMGKALYEIPGKTSASPSRMISGQQQLRQTVARSTVPLSDIKGLGYMSTPPRSGIGGENSVPSGAAGVYNKESNDYPAHIGVLQSYTHTFVPIHEIGHHTDQASPYNTPHDKGRAEGFADAYADKHARKPGYKSRTATVPQRSEENFGVWTKGMSYPMAQAFEQKYHEQRPAHLQAAQFGQPGKDLPKNHVKGQVPLLEKVNSYDRVGSPVDGFKRVPTTNWDYNRSLNAPEAPKGVPEYLNKTYGMSSSNNEPDPAGYKIKLNKG